MSIFILLLFSILCMLLTNKSNCYPNTEADIAYLQDTIKNMQNKYQELEQRINTLETKVEVMKEQIDAGIAKDEELEQRINTLENTVNVVENNYGEFRNEFNIFQGQVNTGFLRFNGYIGTINAEIRKLREDIGS